MIPAEAVDVAARGLATSAWGDWAHVPNALRPLFLRDARIALEAAAPYMLAGAWAEGYAAGVRVEQPGWTKSPYRPTP